MPRTKTKTKPSPRADRTVKPAAKRGVGPMPAQTTEWPEVLTLAEAAAYLRVPETEVVRMVGPQGLPGRLIGSEWRFSRAAVQEWLGRPSMKERLLQIAVPGRTIPTLRRCSRRSTGGAGGP